MPENYERHPIILSKNTAIVIHVYTRLDRICDMWMYDDDMPYFCDNEIAAKQLIDQLEDHWTPAFLLVLRDRITETLKEHDKEYGTKFA